ncbi:MAG: endonuclease MutS2, partial [Oscillospiraceae bacterium]
MTEERYLKTLEFDKILNTLADLTICPDAGDKAYGLTPFSNLNDAQRSLNLTVGANTLSNKYGYPNILKTENCASYLHRAVMGGALSLHELLAVLKILKTMRNLDSYKKQAEGENPLDYLFECLYLNRDLENRLGNSIVSDEELDDNASSELSDIRRKMRNAALKVRSQLDSMIHSQSFQKFLQEPIVTIRDGRFVIPVKAEYKNEVKGLIHDTSASGASLFIEPMSVVTLNNEIRVLENKEKLEEERIIAELSSLVGDFEEEINAGYSAAAELDFCFAKSKLADKMRANIPILTDNGRTVLKKARHPSIPYERAVPIDISVGGEYDTLVITGPNTGGKTVAIKTLGLLSLMAASGLMIPASSQSEAAIYKSVLSDIGDEQSIEQSLSTFSAHMTNIISIVKKAESGTLVLLDELGAGTDPVEGAALAVSIIEELRKKGAN